MSTFQPMPFDERTSERVRARWGWFLALGILFIIGGTLALLSPLLTTLTTAIFVGAAFLVAGIFQIIHAFQMRGWDGFGWHLAMGLVSAIGGFIAVMDPLTGAVAITLVLAATFVAQGVVQIMAAFKVRPRDGWGWLALSGVLAILTGLVLAFSWFALGVFVAISVIFTGWAYVAIALAARRFAG
jgi:uncharacterized membrane protein HdeD (DUF308 family)